MSHLNIAKFGGSSLATASGIFNCATLSKIHQYQLVVVSANGKTTQNLHDLWWHFCQGNEKKFQEIYEKISRFYSQIVADLPIKQSKKEVFEALFEGLQATFEGVEREKAFSQKIRDQILGFGERFSMTLFSLMSGYEAIPASDFLVTDSQYGQAQPLVQETREKIAQVLVPALEEGKLIVTEGFVGQDQLGFPTTVGFEGSDYTAALLADFLNVESLTIWTDVAGIYTADPRLVFEPAPIKALSYDFASQISAYGAKILHERTLDPLRKKEIPLTVKSSFRPDAPGTQISHRAEDKEMILTYHEGRALIHNLTEEGYKRLKEKFDVFQLEGEGFFKIFAIVIDETRSKESFMEDVFQTLFQKEKSDEI